MLRVEAPPVVEDHVVGRVLYDDLTPWMAFHCQRQELETQTRMEPAHWLVHK